MARNRIYEVYMPTHEGPTAWRTGATVSTHRTAVEASHAIDAEKAALRRRPGYETAWLERGLRAIEDGEARRLNEEEIRQCIEDEDQRRREQDAALDRRIGWR
jgi:hypothetical protein